MSRKPKTRSKPGSQPDSFSAYRACRGQPAGVFCVVSGEDTAHRTVLSIRDICLALIYLPGGYNEPHPLSLNHALGGRNPCASTRSIRASVETSRSEERRVGK